MKEQFLDLMDGHMVSIEVHKLEGNRSPKALDFKACGTLVKENGVFRCAETNNGVGHSVVFSDETVVKIEVVNHAMPKIMVVPMFDDDDGDLPI